MQMAHCVGELASAYASAAPKTACPAAASASSALYAEPGGVVHSRHSSAAESGVGGGKDADGLYPHAWLVSSVAWPEEVDPARREQHLCRADFQRLMAMDVDAFNKLPAWKQMALRKKHDLF